MRIRIGFCLGELKIRSVASLKIPMSAQEGVSCRIFLVQVLLVLMLSLCSVQGPRAETRNTQANGTKIVVLKEQQLLELYLNGDHVKSYRVCLGGDPLGPKRFAGDQRTPEGEYTICYKSQSSRFHRFLGISYPSTDDAQVSFANGLISLNELHSLINTIRANQTPPWDSKLGGWVGIHGYPTNDYLRRWASLLYPKPDNWTDGCIAMWNFEIDELYSRVQVGTPVSIRP